MKDQNGLADQFHLLNFAGDGKDYCENARVLRMSMRVRIVVFYERLFGIR